MATADRRKKQSLDESYRYFRGLKEADRRPDLFKLIHGLRTVSNALELPFDGHFRLTKQLWRQIYRALFDTLISSFAGHLIVYDEDGNTLEPRSEFPEEGTVCFYPEGCKRSEDLVKMEIARLHPSTRHYLARAWRDHGARITPEAFAAPDASFSGYFIRHVVPGDEVMCEEASLGRERAHNEWLELQTQVSAADAGERERLIKIMQDLESVWGNLSY